MEEIKAAQTEQRAEAGNETVGKSGKINFCGRCGSQMQEGQKFCKKCGQPAGTVPAGNMVNTVSQFNQNAAAKKSKKKLWIVITSIVLAVGILGTVGYNRYISVLNTQKTILQEKLIPPLWHRHNYEFDCGEHLKFSENEIEHTIFYNNIGTQRYHTSYKVINGDTIMVNSKKIKVRFGDATVLFSPSFTDDESVSFWYD